MSTKKILKCSSCGYECDRGSTMKRHKQNAHNEGVEWKMCPEPGCVRKFKQKSTLTQHLQNIHNIGVKWNYCPKEGCAYKCKQHRDIKKHLIHAHSDDKNVEIKWLKCPKEGCDKKFKETGNLNQHLQNIHKEGVKWKMCPIEGCDERFKRKNHLKRHLSYKHDINVRWWMCENCDHKCKSKGDLKKHYQDVHNRNIKWLRCPIENCKSKFKHSSHLNSHLQNVHDVGKETCDYCHGNCFKRTVYVDINIGKVKICRGCFHKVTGKDSRAEEQAAKIIEKSKFSPYVILKDKILYNDVCNTKRRPDLLLSSGNLHIIFECDEKQHKYYNPSCEWGRMDEIIDEFKTGKIIFVRWNPDHYTPPKENHRKNREERLKTIIDLLEEITTDPPPNPISIYYMFYDASNPVIAKRWNTYFIY